MESNKVVKWDDLTLAQRDDLELLNTQKAVYESTMVNPSSDKSYKSICDALYKAEKVASKEAAKLAKEASKEAAKLAKETEKQNKIEQFKQDSMSTLNIDEWFYVEQDEKFVRYVPETGWMFLGEKGFRHGYGLYKHSVEGSTVDPLEATMEHLRANHRIKEVVKVIWSGDVPANVLNCATVDGWLEPSEGDVDVIFDILLKSVFGGNQEVVDNFEHTIAYAYLHPEVGNLPCFVLYGQGGAGKNELCELVMPTVFTKHMCFSGTPDLYFEGFTGHLLGKKFLLVDEAGANSISPEKLRNKVGAKSMVIHSKGMTPFQADNVAIWVIVANEQTGMKFLRGDDSDRRYTIQMLTKNIMEWVAEDTGLEYIKTTGSTIGSGPAVDWWFENQWKLSSKEHVSKWVNRIIRKYASSAKPFAVHGESYRNMLENSLSPLDRMIRDVFDEDFVFITSDEMFDLYKKYVEDESIDKSAKFAASKTSMTRQVKSWLKINRPNYTIDKRVKLGGRHGSNTQLYHRSPDAVASDIPENGRCGWIERDYMGEVIEVNWDKKKRGVVVDFEEAKETRGKTLRDIAKSL